MDVVIAILASIILGVTAGAACYAAIHGCWWLWDQWYRWVNDPEGKRHQR